MGFTGAIVALSIEYSLNIILLITGVFHVTFYKAVNLVRFSYSHQIMNLFVIDVWVRNGCHHLVNFIFVNNVIVNLWCPHPFKLGFINFFLLLVVLLIGPGR